MKRLLLLTLFVMMLPLAVQAAPAAQDQDESEFIVDLAQYAPDGTTLYAAVRTDVGYFDTLSAVANNIIAQLPPEAGAEPIDLSALIASEIPFSIDWLGDAAAVYLPSLEDALFSGLEFPFIITASLADVDAATNFFDSVLTDGVTRSELDNGAIFYEAEIRVDPSVLIAGDVVFIGVFAPNFSNVVLPGDDLRDLSQSDAFADAIDALPEGDAYNAFAYVDLGAIGTLVQDVLPMLSGQGLPPELAEIDLTEALGQLAVGAVIYDERALMLDIALTSEALADFIAAEPVDLDLLELAPADTVAVIQGTALGPRVIEVVDIFATLDALITSFEPSAFDGFGPLRPASISTFLRLSFEGTYGMDLDETLGALDGDFAFYLTANYNAESNSIDLGSNALLVSSNPDNTAQFVEELTEIVTESFNAATFEDGILDIPFGAVISMPDLLTLTVATDDEIVVVGSPQDVDFALEPGDDSLSATDAFVYDDEMLILDDAISVWYLATEPIVALVDDLIDAEILSESEAGQVGLVTLLVGLLDSATISAATPDGEAFVIRVTLTFAAAE
jgi:hypothetical protein